MPLIVMKLLLYAGLFICLVVLGYNLMIWLFPEKRIQTNSRRQARFSADMFDEKNKESLRTVSGQKMDKLLIMAGRPLGMTVATFRLVEMLFIAFPMFIIIIYGLYIYTHGANFRNMAFILTFCSMVGLMVSPGILLKQYASARETRIRVELSTFAHRVVICLTEKSDTLEIIRRASRNLKIIKPYVNELVVQWPKDSENAVRKFGENIGLPESKAIISALMSIRTTAKENTTEIFNQQVKNIDITVDFSKKKRNKVLPIYTILIVMIPFFAVLVLIMAPWLFYLGKVLNTSF